MDLAMLHLVLAGQLALEALALLFAPVDPAHQLAPYRPSICSQGSP